MTDFNARQAAARHAQVWHKQALVDQVENTVLRMRRFALELETQVMQLEKGHLTVEQFVEHAQQTMANCNSNVEPHKLTRNFVEFVKASAEAK